ncbi:hypothetical protein Tco_0529143 [Tanacetum coccineum]
MERKVDTLMKDAILLMGRSEGVFRMTTNEMYQPPPEPSRQKEFEHIVINFILDQKEIVKQLEEYMKVIIGDFMQLFSEVTRRLKDKIREEGGRLRKIKKITKYPDKEVPKPLAGQKFPETPAKKTFHDTLKSIPTTPLWIRYTMSKRDRSTRGQSSSSQGVSIKEKVRMLRVFESGMYQMRHDTFARCRIHSGDIIVLDFLANQGLDQAFFEAINKDPFSGVRFRLGGEQKEISLLELGWRISLYSERQSRESATLMTAIRDPRVKLAHRCIAMTIVGRNESTHKVIEIDLFYLYCIYSDEVVYNIPYWLAKYMVGMREKILICEGMFVTRITRSYGLLTNEMMGALSVEPSLYVFKKKSLISMGVVMELHNVGCFWPAAREAVEEDEENDEGDKAAGGGACHEGAGCSVDMYRNIS